MFIITKFLLLIALTFNFSSSFQLIDDLIVEIDDGKILGRAVTSISGRNVRAFTGIPYAEKPINDLRFKAPQKVKSWNGTLIAQSPPNMCLQFNPYVRSYDIIGSEDCLYLNVYTHEKSDKLKPVIFWIHGGGMVRGDGFGYDPEYFMDQDVVFVSANYRLGTLGFLSTEDEHITGNFGFKDQSFVLKWIQKNIEYFNGDPNSVTIFGESAGGACVHYHMNSPLSRGLFHRAISHSGTISNGWSDVARRGVALNNTINIAKRVNCTSIVSSEIVACLRNESGEDLAKALANMYVEFIDPAVLLQPVIESFNLNNDDDKPFISERDFVNNSISIPWLVGMNSEEGLLRVGAMTENEYLVNELIDNWHRIISHTFHYDHLDVNVQQEITGKIEEFYFNGNVTISNKNDNSMRNLIDMWTDGWFTGGFFESLKYRFEATMPQLNNTYVYYFTHKSTASFSASTKFYGTSHVDDLIPLFSLRKLYFFSSMPTAHDMQLSKTMITLWINFATTGNPNSNNLPVWPFASNLNSFKYLQLGNENGNSQSLFQLKDRHALVERGEFWIQLRKDYDLNSWLGGNNNSILLHSCTFLIGFMLLLIEMFG